MDARNISAGKGSYDETKVSAHDCLYNKVANNFALESIENNEKLIKN